VPGKIRGKEGSEAALTFRLPRTLYEKLKEAAAGRSVSEEMRQRLEASFAGEINLPDEPTRKLLGAIAAMARMLDSLEERWRTDPGPTDYFPEWVKRTREIGSFKWHETPYGFAVFKRAIEMLLNACEPRSEPPPGPELLPSEADAAVLASLGAINMGEDVVMRLFNRTRREELQGYPAERSGPEDKA
jgi:hypothetical protein